MLLLRFMLVLLLATVVVGLSACGGGGGGGGGGSSDSSDPNANVAEVQIQGDGFPMLPTAPANNSSMLSCQALATIPANSSISGIVQYQRVPSTINGLDYASTLNLPARGVVVQAVEVIANRCSETVVATSLTNGLGKYGLDVPANQSVCVQVRAQLYRDDKGGGASWDIQVLDNVSSDAPYYLVDNTMASPAVQPIRNFLAGSGAAVGSSNYSADRAAAPFAILDTLCEALSMVVAADTNVALPQLLINWSENNIAASGELEDGEVGGAFYQLTYWLDSNDNVTAEDHKIYLLGDKNNDTDEYDPHVIMHEFAHFITGSLSRYDAPGGEHSLGDRLDIRLAFEEGWADAFAGMALNSATFIIGYPHIYRDSMGFNQQQSFRFLLDRNVSTDRHNVLVAGWYSESSVFSILYNLFDADNDNVSDVLTLGFSPIYNVLTGAAFNSSDSLLSIYTFINHLKRQRVDAAAAIDLLVEEQGFEVIADDFGSNETAVNNDVASKEDVAPLYHELSLNADITVCSNAQFGSGNKLSATQFIKFNAANNRLYHFVIQPVNGSFNYGQALLSIYRRGRLNAAVSAEFSGESLTHSVILSGLNVLTLTDVNNIDEDAVNTGRRCFSVHVE